MLPRLLQGYYLKVARAIACDLNWPIDKLSAEPVSINPVMHQSPPARGQASVPGIPTAFSGRVFARKNFSCAPETVKSIRSPVGIHKLYVDRTYFPVFRAHLHSRSFV